MASPLASSPPPPYRCIKRRYLRTCYICDHRDAPDNVASVGPFMIHKQGQSLVSICPCSQKAHTACMANKEIQCDLCHFHYRRRWRFGWARVVGATVHLLTLVSVIGLVFGLAQLGRALDQLGLGSEAGAKLDGDENWHDQEMEEISDWLDMVHFVTGWAGEALLGLVYLVGLCGVIGLNRTLCMLHHILGVDLSRLYGCLPSWISRAALYVCLVMLGLALGTYLLLYSWCWACLLQHVCRRILNVRPSSSPPSLSPPAVVTV